jgi:hypothetical protein
MDADAIWEELQRVNSLLDDAETPADRQRLLDHKAELQQRARAVAEEGVPAIVFELELEEAKRRWIELQHERIDPIKHSGGDFGGDIKAGVDVIYMNKKIDAAQGRAELEARIAELRRLLESRHDGREPEAGGVD